MVAMRKRLIGLGFGIAMLMLFVGCGVAAPVGADVNSPETTEYVITTTEESTTAAPREWPGVPEVYWDILNSPGHFPTPAAGFALVDINGDGVLELVIAGHYELLGLYTQQNGHAYRLGIGGIGRQSLSIAQDGTVIGSYSRGIFSSRLEPHATRLTNISHMEICFVSYPIRWLDEQGSPERELTAQEHEMIRQQFWSDIPMQLNVIWFDE